MCWPNLCHRSTQKWSNLHGCLLTYAMHHHRDTIKLTYYDEKENEQRSYNHETTRLAKKVVHEIKLGDIAVIQI